MDYHVANYGPVVGCLIIVKIILSYGIETAEIVKVTDFTQPSFEHEEAFVVRCPVGHMVNWIEKYGQFYPIGAR